MTAPAPDAPARRPWYRRKRWAAAVLWVSAMYPLAPAPMAYLYGRGWLSGRAFDRVDRVAFAPLASALAVVPGTVDGRDVVGWWRSWVTRCYELGDRHRVLASE